MQSPTARSGLAALSLDLSKHLAASSSRGDSGGNLVFSPLSVFSALALVAEGARGDTLQELLDALGAEITSRELAGFVRGVAERALSDRSWWGGPTIPFAGGVWCDAAWALRPGFRDVAAESYKAEARIVDFRNQPAKAASEINQWAAGATNYRIDSILDPTSVRPDTRLVLANAIYFKGKWEDPFTKANTTTDTFYLLDGRAVDAQFMTNGLDQYVAVHDGFKVLKLPYKSPALQRDGVHVRYSLNVFLPDARDGLPALVDRMASFKGSMQDYLPRKRVRTDVFRLPKFKLSFSGSLKHVLRDDLGINAAFDAERADFSDMAEAESPDEILFVGDVYHRAVLEVDEEGTEAAAVTACDMFMATCCAPPPRSVDFVADHPFAFFLIEELSGAIIFAGHVLDPSTCPVPSYDFGQLGGFARFLGRAMGLSSCI